MHIIWWNRCGKCKRMSMPIECNWIRFVSHFAVHKFVQTPVSFVIWLLMRRRCSIVRRWRWFTKNRWVKRYPMSTSPNIEQWKCSIRNIDIWNCDEWDSTWIISSHFTYIQFILRFYLFKKTIVGHTGAQVNVLKHFVYYSKYIHYTHTE